MSQPTIPRRMRHGCTITAVITTAAMLSCSGGCASQPVLRTADPDVRIVAFGDSATRSPSGADYPSLLPELLSIPATAVANEGQSGETTDAGLRRLGVLIDRGSFPNADTLIYWQGGTDIIDFVEAHDPGLRLLDDDPDPGLREEFDAELHRIEENITVAVARARAAGWKVYLVTYYPPAPGLPCPLLPSDELRPDDAPVINGYVEGLNARIRTVATDAGATLVDVADLGEMLLDNPANYFDCNHLSASGNAQVAELVAVAIGS